MNGWWPLALLALGAFTPTAHAQVPSRFGGLYAGVEGGPVSYNTRITFDGVDDPAGRGGAVYGVALGYLRPLGRWVLGLETTLGSATVPDPYTFDPSVTGFAELDLRRERGVSLAGRAGRVVAERLLVHGSIGYARATQSVRLDGVRLSEYGGSGDVTFGTLLLGAGIEVGVATRLGLRFDFRSLGGHDLSADDFGSVVPDAGLTFLDVEPGQHRLTFGVRYRL